MTLDSGAEEQDLDLSRARERLGRTLRGKWHLDRLLGVGGMAAVYAATHRNGKQVAIKRLSTMTTLERAAKDTAISAAVSAKSGLTVFAGWSSGSAQSGYVVPKEWSPGAELGTACSSSVPRPAARGFAVPGTGAGALPDDEVNAAMNAVWSTSLPDALAKGFYLFPSLVLRYTHQFVGPNPPEWVVLVNAGYLE